MNADTLCVLLVVGLDAVVVDLVVVLVLINSSDIIESSSSPCSLFVVAPSDSVLFQC